MNTNTNTNGRELVAFRQDKDGPHYFYADQRDAIDAEGAAWVALKDAIDADLQSSGWKQSASVRELRRVHDAAVARCKAIGAWEAYLEVVS